MSKAVQKLPHLSKVELVHDLEALLAGLTLPGDDMPRRHRAVGLGNGNGSDEATLLSVLALTADAVSALARTRASSADACKLVERVAGAVGLPFDVIAARVCLDAVRDPRLLALPPRLGIEAQLGIIFALGPLRELSLWTTSAEGETQCIVSLGPAAPGETARREAVGVLRGETSRPRGERARIHAVAVGGPPPHAAIVVCLAPEERERGLAYAREAAAIVRPAVEKEALLERNVARETALVESSERRLTRVGFDLHDGPIQELAALAGDVRFFREQLARVLGEGTKDLVLGRVDDLEARLRAVDGELRSLARSSESPTTGRPLPDVLRHEVNSFAARSDIETSLEVEGDLSTLTASQRIALLRIVHEALSNVREHSGADKVRVTVVGRGGSVRAEIVDNGQGFDVEETLVRAARRGRLGLVGMTERVRLLGGAFDVQSQPGGPTLILLELPEWHPFSTGQARDLEGEQEQA
jgi:signal transduction histidine kinase